jgi:pimeloyl-ACP methyl ester carboxylesterase
MPKILVNGIQLYYEEAGGGIPMLFVHEFAGDCRSWEPQMRFFSGRYRAITFSARGYLPSDVPDSPEAYSQHLQVEDLNLRGTHILLSRRSRTGRVGRSGST